MGLQITIPFLSCGANLEPAMDEWLEELLLLPKYKLLDRTCSARCCLSKVEISA